MDFFKDFWKFLVQCLTQSISRSSRLLWAVSSWVLNLCKNRHTTVSLGSLFQSSEFRVCLHPLFIFLFGTEFSEFKPGSWLYSGHCCTGMCLLYSLSLGSCWLLWDTCPLLLRMKKIYLSASCLGLLCQLQNWCCKPAVLDSSASSSIQFSSSRSWRNSRKKLWEETLDSLSLHTLSSISFPPAYPLITLKLSLYKYKYQ